VIYLFFQPALFKPFEMRMNSSFPKPTFPLLRGSERQNLSLQKTFFFRQLCATIPLSFANSACSRFPDFSAPQLI
jgi:hypothetical protein